MALTDEELLDFDSERLADFDPARAEQQLRDHPHIFRNHLRIGRWVQQWADRLEESPPGGDVGFDAGYVQALREVAAHLRQGDLLPDEVLLAEAE